MDQCTGVQCLFDPEYLKLLTLLVAAGSLLIGVISLESKWVQDRREYRRKQIVAGNLALAVIGQYWNDFEIIKKQFQERRATIPPHLLKTSPWIEVRLVPFLLSDTINFDRKELDFLIKDSFLHPAKPEILGYLFASERKHRDLAALLKLYSGAAEKLYPKCFEAENRAKDFHEAENRTKDFDILKETEELAGPLLIAQVTQLVNAVWVMLDETPQVHQQAFQGLP